MGVPAIYAGAAGIAGGLGSRLLGRAVVAGLAGLLALLLVVMAPLLIAASLLDGRPDSRVPDGLAIPAGLVAVLEEAARVWDVNVFLLAAVGYQESRLGAGHGWNTVNASGCAGLMQLGVGGACGDTWKARVTLAGRAPTRAVIVSDAHRYGRRPASYPSPTPSHPAVLDAFDNVMGAAVWLRHKAHGRPLPHLDTRALHALCGYYGACADPVANYARDVLARARSWQTVARTGRAPSLDDLTTPSTTGLSWPVARDTPVTSRFCEQRSYEPCHPGVDLALPAGTALWSVADGRVTIAGPTAGYGRFVCVDHGHDITSCYAHLGRIAVTVGQIVLRGQRIGSSGCTGRCHGPHLHFEIRIGGQVTCPAAWLAAPEGAWCDPAWRQRAPA